MNRCKKCVFDTEPNSRDCVSCEKHDNFIDKSSPEGKLILKDMKESAKRMRQIKKFIKEESKKRGL